MTTHYAVASMMAADHRRELQKEAAAWGFSSEGRSRRPRKASTVARRGWISRVRGVLHHEAPCPEPSAAC
jgi:hypothetical protein